MPPPCGPGDRVGVAALSGPVDPERLEAGLATLRRIGFEPVLAENALTRSARADYLAGDDAERLRAFHALASDSSLRAILFTRGGYGAMRLLPGIDWDLLRRFPRAYVGFSDLTPFLLSVVTRLGLAAFHGPMVGADLARPDFPAEDEASLLAALAGVRPPPIACAPYLRPGEAEGPLLGGCLSLLAATLGTPYFPDLSGSILFWEDLNEPPYRIDRMLTHLKLSGNLAGIKGMIVGHVAPLPDSPSSAAAEFARVTRDSAEGFRGPLAWGLPAGHWSPNRTLPLGVRCRLDGDEPRLILGEG